MKRVKKIYAFTLSEIIIVLILTSIVAGLAFSVLRLVQIQMNGIRENFNRHTTINMLETSLWLDFNRYTNIEYNILKKELKLSSEIKTITYQFHQEYIIKDTDTFNIQLDNKQFYFNGLNTEKGKIDALKLTSTKAFQSRQLFIFKQNDANAFMN